MGDLGSIPGLGRSPGEGNDHPLQHSGLENSMDRGAWQAPWGLKELDTTEWLPLTHFLVAWILLQDSAGQECRQHMTKMTCLCTTVSGTSGGKIQRLGWLGGWELEFPEALFTHVSGAQAGTTQRLGLLSSMPTCNPQHSLDSSHYDIIRVVRLLLWGFEGKYSSQHGEATLNSMSQHWSHITSLLS